jgi:5-methylthioadenosine/S-adenosylhomocysteine deaminase
MGNSLLIENGTVVTMNDARDVLDGVSVAVVSERIVALGPQEELRARYPSAEHVDFRGKVILPGLINCHTHVSMSLQKGVTLAVEEGLYRVMWPVEKSLTADDCYVGALAGAAEAVLGGSTCVVDHYFHMEDVARATVEVGVRGVLGHTIMSRLGPIVGEQELEEGMAFVERWQGKNPLVIPCLAPHASDTVARDWLLRLRTFATEHKVPLHLHLAQSPREREYIQQQYGTGCVRYLYELGFLGPDVLAAHCIYIDGDEIDLLASSGTHPIYCPMGHALGGRPMRAWEMLQHGAKAIIGTDCVCSNNVMDLVGELRIAGASQRQMTHSKDAMPASRILELVTRDAAEAIGMSSELGRVAPGYLADLTILDFDGLSTAPNYSLLNNIVYCCTGRDVNSVLVNGKIVVRDHRLVTMDEGELVNRIDRAGRGLMKRALASDAELSWLWRSSYGGTL